MLETPKASATMGIVITQQDTMDNQQVTSIAWLAGIIDGEGSVGFNVTTEHRNGKGKGKKQILPLVQLSSTSYDIIEKCVNTCNSVGIGSNVVKNGRKTDAGSTVWQWSLVGAKRVGALLPLVIPHLTCKRSRAESVVSFIESRDGKASAANAHRFYTEYELSLVQATREGSSETTRETPIQ